MTNSILMRFSGSLVTEAAPSGATCGTFSYDLNSHVCSVSYDTPPMFDEGVWEYRAQGDEQITSVEQFDALYASGDLVKRLSRWAALNGYYCTIDRWAKPKLGVGEHHPRIWRRQGPQPHEVGLHEVVTDAMVAFRGLESSILDVFSVLHPTEGNKKAHGHRIRELLILCCTEVELLLVDAANANGLQPSRGRHHTMKDYVRLSQPLGLPQWGVTLVDYPAYGEMFPFTRWSSPSHGLTWYAAYNHVKHGRRAHFTAATLENLLMAAGAIVVLLAAEFGEGLEMKFEGNYRLFWVSKEPEWAAEDGYLKPASGSWIPVPLPSIA